MQKPNPAKFIEIKGCRLSISDLICHSEMKTRRVFVGFVCLSIFAMSVPYYMMRPEAYRKTVPADDSLATTTEAYLKTYMVEERCWCISNNVEKYLKTSAIADVRVKRQRYIFSITPWKIKPDTPRSSKVILNNSDIQWSMAVFIKSRPTNFLQRKVARWTWAGFELIDGLRVEAIFILGNAIGDIQARIQKENETHGDILQVEIEDNYSNVIHKTVSGMQYASENFPPTWFYTSADDDMMPDLNLFKEKLQQMVTMTNKTVSTDKYSNCTFNDTYPILCGFGYNLTPKPRRSNSSKWYITLEQYPLPYYPPYCNGGWYTMSVHLAGELYSLTKRTNYFWIDDMWITGLLRMKHFSGLVRNCFLNDTQVGLFTFNSQYLAFSKTGNEDHLMNQWAQLAAKIYQKNRVHVSD